MDVRTGFAETHPLPAGEGVRVEVISFRGNTSSDLIEVADLFTDIVQLARVEKGSRSGRLFGPAVTSARSTSWSSTRSTTWTGSPRRCWRN